MWLGLELANGHAESTHAVGHVVSERPFSCFARVDARNRYQLAKQVGPVIAPTISRLEDCPTLIIKLRPSRIEAAAHLGNGRHGQLGIDPATVALLESVLWVVHGGLLL